MKPVRTALFSLLFVYLALLVLASLNFERASRWMSAHPGALPYFTLIGLGALLILFGLGEFERRQHHKALAKKEAEKNEIKARVYEMQRKNDEIEESLRSFEQSVARKGTRSTPTKPEEDL